MTDYSRLIKRYFGKSHLEGQEVEGRMISTRIKLLGLVGGMTGGRN